MKITTLLSIACLLQVLTMLGVHNEAKVQQEPGKSQTAPKYRLKSEQKETVFSVKNSKLVSLYGNKDACKADYEFVKKALEAYGVLLQQCNYQVEVNKSVVFEEKTNDSITVFRYCIEPDTANPGTCALQEFSKQVQQKGFLSKKVAASKAPVSSYCIIRNNELILLSHYGYTLDESFITPEALVKVFRDQD